MDVVISSPNKFHAYYIVRGAQNAGLLKRFIIGLYDRREDGIPADKVRQLPLIWYLARALEALPGQVWQYLSYWLTDNLFDRWVARTLEPCDILHCFNHSGLHTIRRAKALGAVTIVERAAAHPEIQMALMRDEYAAHGLTLPTVNRKIVDKQLREYHEADYIAVPSEFVYRTMVEAGIPPEKLLHIHLGFDPTRFRPGPKQDDVFRVMYAGALSLQKGLPYLLEAFTRLALPNSELLLVGRVFPDARAVLAKYKGHYRLIDFVPQDRLVSYYQQASVFVLPSIQDGFGMVVYEAAGCGIPLIISQNVGTPIRDGQDGFIVPIRDAGALAEKLDYLYSHPEERAAIGQSAYNFVQQFTWAHYYKAWAGHYHRIWQVRQHTG